MHQQFSTLDGSVRATNEYRFSTCCYYYSLDALLVSHIESLAHEPTRNRGSARMLRFGRKYIHALGEAAS
jgi:hypothetical protein